MRTGWSGAVDRRTASGAIFLVRVCWPPPAAMSMTSPSIQGMLSRSSRRGIGQAVNVAGQAAGLLRSAQISADRHADPRPPAVAARVRTPCLDSPRPPAESCFSPATRHAGAMPRKKAANSEGDRHPREHDPQHPGCCTIAMSRPRARSSPARRRVVSTHPAG
jgi:hypothetical protein